MNNYKQNIPLIWGFESPTPQNGTLFVIHSIKLQKLFLSLIQNVTRL